MITPELFNAYKMAGNRKKITHKLVILKFKIQERIWQLNLEPDEASQEKKVIAIERDDFYFLH